MLLNQHFINYFVRNLYSSWLVFLRVVQKKQKWVFFLNTVYMGVYRVAEERWRTQFRWWIRVR